MCVSPHNLVVSFADVSCSQEYQQATPVVQRAIEYMCTEAAPSTWTRSSKLRPDEHSLINACLASIAISFPQYALASSRSPSLRRTLAPSDNGELEDISYVLREYQPSAAPKTAKAISRPRWRGQPRGSAKENEAPTARTQSPFGGATQAATVHPTDAGPGWREVGLPMSPPAPGPSFSSSPPRSPRKRHAEESASELSPRCVLLRF